MVPSITFTRYGINHKVRAISLESICLTYANHRVFDDLTMCFEAGFWHSILGRSGVGKTSLLRLIAGLQTPDSGSVNLLGSDADNNCKAPVHHQVAYVPQEDSLLPWLSVLDNVQLGPRLRGQKTKETSAQAMQLIERIGLAHWADALPAMLSGGMRQRVALARALLENPPVVLMDEPFSGLDAITRHELQAMSSGLLKERTVILVTHDPSEALRLSHVVHVIPSGANSQCPRISLKSDPPRPLNSQIVTQHLPQLWQLLSERTTPDNSRRQREC
ncbi:MAG: ABC transporter ATP-binding protein [Granulosicoccus sp.]